MSQYNFDQVIERHGSGAIKYDALQERYGKSNLIPLWVADMDFATPPFIVEALRKRMEHPIFGYTEIPNDYLPTIAQWVESHHGWKVDIDWITYIPGIVKGIGMAINVFVKEGEKVIIQPPVYHPFRLTTQGNGREVVYNPLKRNCDGSYSMDFDNLAKVTDEKCRLLILSNPHNPAGIVWDRDTLVRLAQFCYERNIIVISDEIHCDLALWDNKHIPFATVSPQAEACSITFGAPSKTFNIAGIVSSYAIVPNDKLRNKFYGWLTANELNTPTMFATIATIEAFKFGEVWRQEMLRYVERNIDFVIDYCREFIPAIHPLRPQASFLIWLDCRDLSLSHQELINLFVDKAHLALNDGAIFGEEGSGFMRLNVGAPKEIIAKALDNLRLALE